MPSPPAPAASAEASSRLTGFDDLGRGAEIGTAPGRGLGLPHQRAGDEDRRSRRKRNNQLSHRILRGLGPSPRQHGDGKMGAATFKAQTGASGMRPSCAAVEGMLAPAVPGDAPARRNPPPRNLNRRPAADFAASRNG